MKQLTKKQVHEVYKEALRRHQLLDKDGLEYLCILLKKVVRDIYFIEWKTINVKLFDEFMLFNPGNEFFTWWGDYKCKETKDHQRIILMFCIEMSK